MQQVKPWVPSTCTPTLVIGWQVVVRQSLGYNIMKGALVNACSWSLIPSPSLIHTRQWIEHAATPQGHGHWPEARPLKRDRWDMAQGNDETRVHDRLGRLGRAIQLYIIYSQDYKGIDGDPLGYKRRPKLLHEG
jgi:hypothetical protein